MESHRENLAMIVMGDTMLDPCSTVLIGPAGRVHIRSQAAVLLALLAKHQGTPVHRETCLLGLYSGPGGGPETAANVLSVTTSELRRTLRSAGSTITVETVWGFGYCLHGPVHLVARFLTPREAGVSDRAVAEDAIAEDATAKDALAEDEAV
ncbi:MAG: hypothetical protein NVS3B2_04610 [Ramlibacter sp.]